MTSRANAPPPVTMDINSGHTAEEAEEADEDQQCRVCTIRSDGFTYFNIFEKMIFKNIGMWEALQMVTSLEIRHDDELPHTICCRCEKRLLDAFHFRKLAESSARSFSTAINGSRSSGEIAKSTTSTAPPATPAVKSPTIASNKPAIIATSRRGLRRSTAKAKATESKLSPSAIQLPPAASYEQTEFEEFAHDQLLDAVGELAYGEPVDESGDAVGVELELGANANTFKIVYEKAARGGRVGAGNKSRVKTVTPVKQEIAMADEVEEVEEAVDEEEEEVEVEEKHLVLELDDEDAMEEGTDDDDDDEDAVSFLTKHTTVASATTTTTTTMTSKTSTMPHPKPASMGARRTPATVEEYERRKYKCEVCGKRFIGRSNLVDHLRHHANVKPFACQHCDKAFVQKGSLVCHMRTHTNEKPFACDVCDKKFSQASSRQIHMRTHTQERCYPCDQCPKAFYSNSDLSKHRRTHDAVHAYPCLYCQHGFAQRSNLRKHVTRKHPEEAAAATAAMEAAVAVTAAAAETAKVAVKGGGRQSGGT